MSEKLGWKEFGKALLETEDLDPVYVMLHKAKLSEGRLRRFLLAYWFFYHVGVSAKLSDYKESQFFDKAIRLAENGKGTPRGTERRHFRGEACLKSLGYFKSHYNCPEEAVDHLIGECNDLEVSDVLKFCKRWPLFGPWIGFKIADMLERVAGVPISFPIKTLEMYDAPTQGAALVAGQVGYLWSENQDDPAPSTPEVVKYLIHKFRHYKAPPSYDRPVGVQEVETILCKWKSHLNGHYPVGKDSKEVREHLHGWGSLAESMIKYVPEAK